MTGCIWLLLSSHGVLMLLLNIILILVPVACMFLSFLIVISIRLQASQQTSSSNEADDPMSMRFFKFFKICTPVMFAITTVAHFLNYIVDLHVENPIDEHWVTKLENACKINTQTITEITSVGLTAVLQFSFFALALFYFFRIVIIFEHSAYAVPKRSRMIVIICSIVCFLIVLFNGSISVVFPRSRNVLALAMVVMFLVFAGFSVYFQRFLIKKMQKIVSAQSTSNPHIQRTFSTLVRMTVLFSVSIASTAATTVIYAAFIAPGLYRRFTEVRAVVTLVNQLDMLVNLLCIALQFQFAEKFYACMCRICYNPFQDKYKLTQAMYSSSTTATAEVSSRSETHQSSSSTQTRTIQIDLEIDE